MTANDPPPAAQTHPTRPARRPPLNHWRARTLRGVVVGVLLVGAAWLTDYFTRRSVTLEVNGTRYALRTHADTVQAALADAGIVITPPDTVWPSPQTALEAAPVITVRKANVVALVAGDRLRYVRTLESHPLDILAEQGVSLAPHDALFVDGEPYTLNALMARSWDVPPQSLYVVPSVSVRVHDGEHTLTLHTTAPNVAGALEAAGVKLYLADRVTPPLDTPVSPDMDIAIERAVPLTVVADGRQLHTRAHGPTVADALVMVGVVPSGLDYTIPPLDAPLEAGMTIRVVRVTEQLITQEEIIPFSMLRSRETFSGSVDKWGVLTGTIGMRTAIWCVRYEDGKEVRREAWDAWLSPYCFPLHERHFGE